MKTIPGSYKPFSTPGRLIRLSPHLPLQPGIDTLRAIPHINYLKKFSRIQWDPSLLGLEDTNIGATPTLVAAPTWALNWLQDIHFTRSSVWDAPLHPLRPWTNKLASPPAGLKISDTFLQSGGFINAWQEEGAWHMIIGQVQADSATSVLTFAWLQNVLAGGKAWRRRELGIFPQSLQNSLPIIYLQLGDKNGALRLHSLGIPAPIILKKNAQLENIRPWITSTERPRQVLMSEVAALYWPSVGHSSGALVFDGTSSGLIWHASAGLPTAFLGLYPSALGAQIDKMQAHWATWLATHVPGLGANSDKLTELLLCLREAVINADKHGCQGRPGKRIMLGLQYARTGKTLQATVSDPGTGHDHNLRSPLAMQHQRMGRHLGLMLIHGLADRVRFLDNGATLQFHFRLSSSSK